MAMAANQKQALFSSSNLEHFAQIKGLAKHIDNRRHATLSECQNFSEKFISCALAQNFIPKNLSKEKNLSALFHLGGVAAVTASEIKYGL